MDLVPTSQRKISIVALALVVGVGPFSTDTYIAALPDMQRDLGTTASLTQLTITFCIVGLAVGMLFAGPLSDSFGRKPFILGGAVLFAVASLACVVTDDVTLLLVLRLLQGLAAGASGSVGRAVIADRYTGVERAQKYGLLGAISLIGPVIAPMIGGLLHEAAGWRSIFVFLGVLGIAMVLAGALGVPETAPSRAQTEDNREAAAERALARMGRRTLRLLRRPAFLAPVIVQCFATGGFFMYIGGSAFVLETQLGISATLYSVVFASNAVAMVTASLVFSRIVGRFGTVRLLWAGVVITLAAVASLFAVSATAGSALTLAGVWPFLVFVVGGMGLTQSATTVLAQNAGSDASGTASSLLSGCAFLVGSATTPTTGVLGGGVVAMAGAMTVFFVVCLAVIATTTARGLLRDDSSDEPAPVGASRV